MTYRIPQGNISEVRQAFEVTERTPGWRIYMEWMAANEKDIVTKMAAEEDPNRLLRLVGALKIAQDAQSFMANQIEALKRQEKQNAERNEKLAQPKAQPVRPG